MMADYNVAAWFWIHWKNLKIISDFFKGKNFHDKIHERQSLNQTKSVYLCTNTSENTKKTI